jgi:hypothetical protein
MSAQEVNDFFEKYVYGFILADIKREIAFAKSGCKIQSDNRSYSGGGNYLCALGLLCYTEFMGGIYLGTFKESSRILFDTFFHLMGPDYEAFDKQLSKKPSMRDPRKKLSAYEVFRCGMVHEYFIKKSGVISMLSGNVHQQLTIEGDEFTLQPIGVSTYKGLAQQGIGILDDGRYFFVVEQYYKDFAETCRKVHNTILNSPNPSIPES